MARHATGLQPTPPHSRYKNALSPRSPRSFAEDKVDALGLLRLLSLLPSEAPAWGSRIEGQGSEFSFTTGAYTYDHGAKLGLRQNCRLFPCVTRALCEYVSTRAPESRYTTLALFRDLRSRVHADLGNDLNSATTFFGFQTFRMAAFGLSVVTAISRAPSGRGSPQRPSCHGTVVHVSFWCLHRPGTMIPALNRMSTTCTGWGSSCQLGEVLRLQAVTVFGWVSANGRLNLRVALVPVLRALLSS